MKRVHVFLMAVATLFSAPLSWAQDDAARQQLVKALKSLAETDVSLVGNVAEEQPESEKNSPLPGVQRMAVSLIGGSTGNPFLGEFEVLVNKELLAIVSTKEFPGVKILQAGEKAVNMQWHAESPFAVQQFSSAVGHLVDWQELSQAVEKASKFRVTKNETGSSIRVVLEPEFIPVETFEKAIAKMAGAAAGGGKVAVQVGSSAMTPQIVDLSATFTVSSAGSVVDMKFDIQYSDPMKAMMANAMRGGPGIRIGGNVPRPKEGEDAELGKLMSYSFKVSGPASQQIKDFVKMAKPYLESLK